VRRAAVSGNLDAPEGGFDAIMQAVVCKQQIDWRNHARRLLVFSTDAGFHYAGDGKLGGVITPNDGECHLDQRGMYSYSDIQDYPSISQINLKVVQNSINVIFAVTKQQLGVYEKLSENIEGSYAAELREDSSNVVDMVKEQYDKITSSVEMKDDSSRYVEVNYYSKCLGEVRTNTSICKGLKVGDVVTFETEILLKSCPENPKDWHTQIHIYPVGINESLTIDLEMLCSCPCEFPGHAGFEEKSSLCNNAGTLKCGICECDVQHFGRSCECSNTDIGGDKNLDMMCRPDNTTLIDCNGRGNCVCGQCDCTQRENPDEVYSGKFCECDNFSCDRHNGQLCAGPDHGLCECGECNCKPGWTGPSCDCRASNDTCIAPNSPADVVCSGHGTCKCGTCFCDVTDEARYSGKYCDKCPTCPGRCADLKECVQCQIYKNGPLTADECSTNCSYFTPTTVKNLDC
jgi:integrin beta 1